MLSNKSVCNIFQTMDLFSNTEEVFDIKAKELLKRYKSFHFSDQTFDSFETSNLKMESSMWKLKVKSIISTLLMNAETLLKILNETIYNTEDSCEIVATFFKDLSFYFENAEDSIFYVKEQESVDLQVSIRDVYIFGRLLAPLLITGYTIIIHPTDQCLVRYLDAIAVFITKAGVKSGKIYLLNSSVHPKDPTRFVISADISLNYCPMIIFDDSDLHSAVDCLIDYCHKFNGMLYWSVTHAYIQESVFKNFICMLERKSCVELIYCNQLDKLQEVESMNRVAKFFIGWDPRDLEINCNVTMSVTLLPFRSADEVVSLVNSQNSACGASLWSDKLSIVNRISKLLKVGTIWINNHGVVDPVVPLESFNEAHLPLSGLQLLEYITVLNNFHWAENESFSINSINEGKVNVHFSKSIEEAITFSKLGYETLKKIEDKQMKQLLDLTFKPHWLGKNDVRNTSSPSDTIYRPSSKLDVLSYSSSHEIILALFPSETLSLNIFLQILYHLLETKNAVIVSAPSTLLNNIATNIPCDLPPGIITLLDIKSYNYNNALAKIIGKQIFFYIKENQNISNDFNQRSKMYSVFLRKKSVWMATF